MRKTLTVNGRAAEIDIEPGDSLLDVLRERLRLVGAKEACGRGECGACTVLVDGTPVMSCVTLAALVRGEVTTIEGLAGETRDLREAFAVNERVVREQMSGNICRCTGYTQIVDAVLTTARRRAVRRQSDLTVMSGGDAG